MTASAENILEEAIDYSQLAILYVDDEPDNLELFSIHFQNDFTLHTATSAEEGLKILASEDIAVVLTDERMPEMNGIEFLAQVVAKWPEVMRVIVSAYSDSDRLLRAINHGHAHEYIVKPWRRKELRACLIRSLSMAQRRRSLYKRASLADAITTELHPPKKTDIVGEEGGLKHALGIARKVARTETSVLVRGETGTGKEVLARYIHQQSARADKPFVKVNCAALSETLLESELFGHEKGAFTDARSRRIGRFELASEGTIFLDEIGDISPRLQVMLLRVLQEREFERVGGTRPIPVNVRVVAATNRDLEAAVEEGTFRQDLYYRLNVFPLSLPPLRQRPEDIGPLLRFFLKKYRHLTQSTPTVGEGLVEALQANDWPGNIREFENMVQRALVIVEDEPLGPEHFYFDVMPAKRPTFRQEKEKGQLHAIQRALEQSGGNCTRAARAMGLARTTFTSRAKKFGLI